MNKLIYKTVKESFAILIITSIISSVGGFGLAAIETKFLKIVPLIILFPALNDMIGDFGTIIASKYTTILFLKGIKKKWWKSKELRTLFKNIGFVALISALYLSTISIFLSGELEIKILIKIMAITSIATVVLTVVMLLIAIIGGLYVYKRGHNPDNYLIPMTTSIADLTSMIMLSILVPLFF